PRPAPGTPSREGSTISGPPARRPPDRLCRSSSGPSVDLLEDLVPPAREQPFRQPDAEPMRIAHRAFERVTHQATPIHPGNERAQRHDAVRDRGVRRNGDLTPAFQSLQEGPLGCHRRPGWMVIQPGDHLPHESVIRAAFERQGPLPDGRQADVRRQVFGHALAPTQPLDARRREDDPVILAGLEFPQPGVEVAPQDLDGQIGAVVQELCLAAQTAGPNPGTRREPLQGHLGERDEDIPWIVPFRNRQDLQLGGQTRRDILHDVARQYKLAAQYSHLYIFVKLILAPLYWL